MTWKPFESKSLMDKRKSTKKDYPPKRKLPSNNESFTEMEQYHYDNYRPWGENPIAIRTKDSCQGRVLRPLSQVEWPSGEGGSPKEGDIKEFQTSVSGAVGSVAYSMDPFFSEVNENGDIATIDPNTGLITLEEGVCQGAYPPWIIYNVCDDCGCSSGTIWLEDSSGDCLDCDDCDCDDTGSDCYAECCMITIGPIDETTTSTTKQFSCGGGGVWSVTGVGASIDQTGLLTTDGTACGTLIVSNTVCQDQEVRVTDSGQWSFVSMLCGTSDGCGGGGIVHDTPEGANRITYCVDCVVDCSTYTCGCVSSPPASGFCAGQGRQNGARWIKLYEWVC